MRNHIFDITKNTNDLNLALCQGMNHLHGDHPSGGDITKTKETPDNEAFVKLQKT